MKYSCTVSRASGFRGCIAVLYRKPQDQHSLKLEWQFGGKMPETALTYQKGEGYSGVSLVLKIVTDVWEMIRSQIKAK